MITLSVDTTKCPACDAALVAVTRDQRRCNTCGFEATVVTEEDEREAKADAALMSREREVEEGRAHDIARFQRTW